MKYPQLLSMPTAVSDWLEEQLEARGVDAVAYTRCVLSILYRDPVDVICSERELQFSPPPNKEVKRSGSGRKRFRRSAGWCGLDLSDADKLKRSAAVQCLMSASDQECGFESLVDELCEKLKEATGGGEGVSGGPEVGLGGLGGGGGGGGGGGRAASPGDPAKRYYAAFPALMPKWRKPRRPEAAPQGLAKFKQLRRHLAHRRRLDDKDFWDFYNGENNKRITTADQKQESGNNFNRINANNNNNNNNNEDWRCSDEGFNMYDDMIQDNIRNLLDSPVEKDDEVSVEMMNIANMKQDANSNAIEHHPMFFDETIWSCKSETLTEDFLRDKLKAISIDPDPNCSHDFFSVWPTEKWSEPDDPKARSLSAINHSEASLFKKVKSENRPNPSPGKLETPPPKKNPRIEQDDEKSIDLWDSHDCRFKPINESLGSAPNCYADGTTFKVDSQLEKIDWKRTSTGFFYVGGDPMRRRYLEFSRDDSEISEFVPKYLIRQDDERLQTETFAPPSARRKLYFSGESEDEELGDYLTSSESESPSSSNSAENLTEKAKQTVVRSPPIIFKRASEVEEEEEVVEAEVEEKEKKVRCVCGDGGGWNGGNSEKRSMDKEAIRDIWKSGGGERCDWCTRERREERGAVEDVQLKLREECIVDGEQLLLDLNSVQNKFLEELPPLEDSLNISELLLQQGLRERKRRRHHPADALATRLQQRVGRLPVLRSITLGRVG